MGSSSCNTVLGFDLFNIFINNLDKLYSYKINNNLVLNSASSDLLFPGASGGSQGRR